MTFSSKLPSIERCKELFYYKDGKVFRKKSPRPGIAKNSEAGHINSNGYLVVGVDDCIVRVHRLVWAIHHNEWPNKFIDHINRNKIDNRIENLRLATKSQNMQNTDLRKDNKSGVKGVFFRKDINKFAPYIQINGKMKYLGCYNSIEEAKAKRLEAEKLYHTHCA